MKKIGVKGEIVIDDMIGTLEQENKQMRARMNRLEKENIQLYEISIRQAVTIKKYIETFGDIDAS